MADYVIQHPGRPLTIPGSTGGGGGGGYTTIEDNTGAALPQRTTLQFLNGLNAQESAGVTTAFLDVGHANTWTALQTFSAGVDTTFVDTAAAGALAIGPANATSVTITPVTIWGGTKKLAALGGAAGGGFEYDSTGNGLSFLSAVTANVGQFAGTTEWNLSAGVVTQYKAAVGTARTVGYSLRNDTAAAVNAQQYSAISELRGAGWDASVGNLASYPLAMGWQLQASQNALTTPTALFALMQNLNNAGYSATPLAYFSNDSNGRLVFPAATRAVPAYVQGSTGTSSAMLLGGSYISLNTDAGQVLLLDTQSAGKEIQPKYNVSPTNGTLKNGNATNVWLETWSTTVFSNTIDGNTADITLKRSGNDGLTVFSNAVRLWVTGGVSGGQGVQIGSTSFIPLTTLFASNGLSSNAWTGTWSRHYSGAGTAPTIATTSPAQLGTGPSVAITAGSDCGGTLTITTGTVPAAFVGGTEVKIATVTFNTAYGTAPRGILLTPANNNAAQAQSGAVGIFCYVKQSTTATNAFDIFAIDSGAGTFAGSTAHAYAWFAIE